MNNIEFKEMQYQYLSEVLDIYSYYVLNSTATFHTEVLTLDEMKEIVFFDNPNFKTFIILDKEVIFGYVILAQFKKREAYDVTAEVTIYLKPDYTGKGIGDLAVKYIEKYAIQKGFHTLLAIICGENENSINLFVSNGYIKCAHYKEVGKKFGRLLDVLTYQKIID